MITVFVELGISLNVVVAETSYQMLVFFILRSGEGLTPSIKMTVPTYRVGKKWCNEAFHGVYLLRIPSKISSSKSSLSLNVKISNA